MTKKIITDLSYFFIALCLMLSALYLYMDKEMAQLNEQTRAELGGHYIQLPDGVAHYQLSPANEQTKPTTTVLVHGFSVPFYLFDPTYDFLVKQNFRVLRFDLFGRGFSDRPDSDYSIDLYVNQLHDLLAALNITGKVNLVGLSMGGAIVTHFTNRYAERVKKVSLIDPLFHTPERPEIKAIKVPGLGEYLAKVLIVPKLLNGLSNTVFNEASFPDWSEKFEPQTHYQGYSSAILRTARFLAGKNFKSEYEQLGRSGIPVQLFWGRQDQVIPFSDSARVKTAVPGIEFHAIDQAGHLPHYEQPEQVNPLISRFLMGQAHPVVQPSF